MIVMNRIDHWIFCLNGAITRYDNFQTVLDRLEEAHLGIMDVKLYYCAGGYCLVDCD